MPPHSTQSYWPSHVPTLVRAVVERRSQVRLGKPLTGTPVAGAGNREHSTGLTALGPNGLRVSNFYAAHSLYLPAHLRSKQAN